MKCQVAARKAQLWGICVEEYGALVHYNDMSGNRQLRSKGLSQKKNQHKGCDTKNVVSEFPR